LTLLVMAVIYGFFGVLTGLIIAAANLDDDSGLKVGIGVGLLICVGRALLTANPFMVVNVFFYFFTGREVGRGLTARIQRLVS
jgi:hypothetical protein